MSLFSRAKNRIKRVTRKVSRVTLRPAVYVTGAVATAGTVFFGPVAGAALTAVGSQVVRYQGTVAARDRGMKGRDARAYGRTYMKRAIVAGAIGTTAGLGLAVGAGALGIAGTGAAGNAAAGTVGSQLLFGNAAPATAQFVTASNLASQPSNTVPGIVTSLGDVGAHGAAPAATAAASTGTGSIWTGLLGAAATGAASGTTQGLAKAKATTNAGSAGGNLADKLAALGGAAADQATGGGLGGLLNGDARKDNTPLILAAVIGGAILLAA